MADFRDVFSSTEYRNWVKCNLAQSLAKDVLSDVVESEIESFRKHILQSAQALTQQPPSAVCKQCMTSNVLKCPTRNVCKINKKGCTFHNGVGLHHRRCPANGMCDSICKQIIDHHRFLGPSWKNTDATKWCTIAWSIAKCYMPPDGYENVNSAKDTDFNGIVNIIINCIIFQKHFKDDLSKDVNICTKVRDNCRRLRHSPTLEMDDGEMSNFIDVLVDILNDSVLVKNHCKSTEMSHKLLKLKTDAMGVSATDINRTLEHAILNLKRVKDMNLAERDPASLRRMVCELDMLNQLIPRVRSRVENALSEQETVLLHCAPTSSTNMIEAFAARVRVVAGTIAAATIGTVNVSMTTTTGTSATMAAVAFCTIAIVTVFLSTNIIGAFAAGVRVVAGTIAATIGTVNVIMTTTTGTSFGFSAAASSVLTTQSFAARVAGVAGTIAAATIGTVNVSMTTTTGAAFGFSAAASSVLTTQSFGLTGLTTQSSGLTIATAFAILGDVAVPIVAMTHASIYVLSRSRVPVKDEHAAFEPVRPQKEDLQKIKVLQEAAMSMRDEVKQLIDQSQFTSD